LIHLGQPNLLGGYRSAPYVDRSNWASVTIKPSPTQCTPAGEPQAQASSLRGAAQLSKRWLLERKAL
jgi:hypothetical protein